MAKLSESYEAMVVFSLKKDEDALKVLAEKVVEVISIRVAGGDVPPVITLPYRLIKRESVK